MTSMASSLGGTADTSLLEQPAPAGAPATPGGPIAIADNFAFPLRTTKSAIKNFSRSAPWCYTKLTNCHHHYNAADIMIGEGVEVVAAVGGTIITKNKVNTPCTGDFGGYPSMQIKGDDGNYYFYAHFKPGSLTSKSPGSGNNKIAQGERLGVVGPDRCGMGITHLHIQWYHDVIQGRGQANEIQPPLVKSFQELPE